MSLYNLCEGRNKSFWLRQGTRVLILYSTETLQEYQKGIYLNLIT